jgi:DNA-directed RNA polymerase subunit beta
LAVSPANQASIATASAIPGAPKRASFAKIREPLVTPDLLDVQLRSFQWFTGDDAWFERAVEEGDDNPVGGLDEILQEISPIEDFSGSMSLSFADPRFDEVKASVEECKEKDMTYSAPLFVTAEFVNNNTGEIKSQTVFMGDFPVMTDKGTFIINGTERVVVSQLVRSPGVYYDQTIDKATDKDVFSVKIIPSRGAWLEFDVDKRDTVGVRIDRKRRQPVTVLLKALGWTTEAIRECRTTRIHSRAPLPSPPAGSARNGVVGTGVATGWVGMIERSLEVKNAFTSFGRACSVAFRARMRSRSSYSATRSLIHTRGSPGSSCRSARKRAVSNESSAA